MSVGCLGEEEGGMTIIDALHSRTVSRLFGKRSAFLLGPQPLGHLEFLPKLAQVLVSSAINYVKLLNGGHADKETQVYQQEYGLSSQDAQDEQYSKPNIKDDSPFTVPLDFERFPFVELRHINAREIESGKLHDVHFRPPLLKSYYHGFHSRINAIREPGGIYDGPG
jgi:hypothetical protein